MRTLAAFCAFAAAIAISPASAAECPGHPNALGTSRTLVVDPSEHGLLGGLQYRESLPLNDHEIVLTFDDGPLPPHTNRVLDALAAECVKATFFMVGQMVRGYPSVVRRVYEEGHTIANHSQTHPFTFHKMTIDAASKQIEDGFTSLRTVLGDPNAVAPFFRIPGLLRQASVENYLTQRDVMVWSVDFVADDWTHIPAHEIVRRAINRIEAKGRGILLLHDIQPATAAGLPDLLRELKARGYHIVQVVPARPDRPKTPTEPEQWVLHHTPGIWPTPVPVVGLDDSSSVMLGAPSPASFGVADSLQEPLAKALAMNPDQPHATPGEAALSPLAVWPHGIRLVALPNAGELPAPAAVNFRYSSVWRPKTASVAATKGAHKLRFRSGGKVAPTAHETPLPPLPGRKRATTGSGETHAAAPRPPKGFIAPGAPVGHQLSIGKPTALLD